MLAKMLEGAGGYAVRKNLVYVGGTTVGVSGQTTDLVVNLSGAFSGGVASSPTAGDILIVFFGIGSTVDRAINISGGYTTVADLYSNDTYDANLFVAYKIMGSTPDTSITLTGGTGSTADGGALTIHAWRNVDKANPMDVTATTATGINSSLIDPPAITPVTSGAVIVTGGCGATVAAPPVTYSATGLSNFIQNYGNDNVLVATAMGSSSWTSGAFNPAAFTVNTGSTVSASWAACTLALRPGF